METFKIYIAVQIIVQIAVHVAGLICLAVPTIDRLIDRFIH